MKRDTEAWNTLESLVQERTTELQQEIIERKRVEEALRHREEQYRTVVENASEGMVVTQDGMLKFVNAAAEKISGYARNELLAIPFVKFVHPDHRKMVEQQHIHKLQGAETSQTYDFKSIDARGNTRWVRNTGVLIEWEGRPATLNFLVDITEQRLAEERLHNYQEHLEELVEARTAELQQEVAERKRMEERLREVNEQLRQANESKDTFFALISHDLRTPLTSLLGYAEVMAEYFESFDREKLKTNLKELYAAAQRLYTLLENLLAWARFQRGMMEYQPTTFAVRTLIEEDMALFQANAEQKQISLILKISEDLHAYADVQMLHTIIRNLLSNALKFTDSEGSVTITARLEDSLIEIAVSDSGIGLSEQEMSQLFMQMDRPIRQGTAGEKGTGVGLMLCRDLVERNGGRLWAESIPGHSTTFLLTIPAANNSVTQTSGM